MHTRGTVAHWDDASRTSEVDAETTGSNIAKSPAEKSAAKVKKEVRWLGSNEHDKSSPAHPCSCSSRRECVNKAESGFHIIFSSAEIIVNSNADYQAE